MLDTRMISHCDASLHTCLTIYCHYCQTFFFFTDPATTDIYTLSLHDALPIWRSQLGGGDQPGQCLYVRSRDYLHGRRRYGRRSEEHTSELQSQFHLVCRLLLEKKKKQHEKAPPSQN